MSDDRDTDDGISTILSDLHARASDLARLTRVDASALSKLVVDIVRTMEIAWLNPASDDRRYRERRAAGIMAKAKR